MNALKLMHRTAVDTALMFAHPRGPPFKPALRVLSERLLNRRIQDGSHDSVADAQATMALARLKFAKGPAYSEMRLEGAAMADLLGSEGVRVALIDRLHALPRLATGSADAIRVTSDKDTGVKAAREVGKPLPAGPGFIWAHLADLGAHQEARAQRERRRAEAQDSAEQAVPALDEPVSEEQVLRQADAAIAAVFQAAPAGALVMVFSGHGDTPEARRLLESKFRRNQGLSGGPWTESDEAQLTRANERARGGLLFYACR